MRLVLVGAVASACSDDPVAPPVAYPEVVADVVTNDVPPPDVPAEPDVPDTAVPDATVPDVDEPAVEPTPRFSAFVSPPAKALLPAEVTSCAVIGDEVCTDETLRRCTLYDAGVGDWATDVPPMTLQAYTFERFYDRYHRMNGQASDVDFTQAVLAGTPESEWSKPEYFERYNGIGDASGWTGTALWGAAARYQVTGNSADYQRMLQHFGDMMFLYEVMDVPGQLARSHFAMLPDGAPRPKGHWGKAISPHRIADGSDGHFLFPIREALLDRLPAYYTEGVEIEGAPYATQPRVMADASRDMYVRSLPGVLLAYDLLGQGEEEERLRGVVKAELPCTMNRLKRGKIINLQQAGDILEAVTTYFAGPSVTLDPDDLDPSELDELTFFIMEQPHPDHLDKFDAACPAGPPMEADPELIYDAADPVFVLKLLELAQRENKAGPVPIAWSMHVTVRPSDMLFVLQWALTAHYVTGDDAYIAFVESLLGDGVGWEPIMKLWGAFQLPKYCAPHYAPSIGYPSLYNVLARVDKTTYPLFWAGLSAVAREEAREKWDGAREDCFFGVLYGRMVDETTDPDRAAFVQENVDRLATYGMNPDDKLEPDRAYPRNFVDKPDPAVPLEEIAPGDAEWTVCEEPVTVFGIEVPPPKIDGVPIRSADPLPLSKRIGGTMLWQMDPWMVKREYGGVGMDTQWPMLGMFTPYWIGRADGLIMEGATLSLGWKDTGEACAEP